MNVVWVIMTSGHIFNCEEDMDSWCLLLINVKKKVLYVCLTLTTLNITGHLHSASAFTKQRWAMSYPNPTATRATSVLRDRSRTETSWRDANELPGTRNFSHQLPNQHIWSFIFSCCILKIWEMD